MTNLQEDCIRCFQSWLGRCSLPDSGAKSCHSTSSLRIKCFTHQPKLSANVQRCCLNYSNLPESLLRACPDPRWQFHAFSHPSAPPWATFPPRASPGSTGLGWAGVSGGISRREQAVPSLLLSPSTRSPSPCSERELFPRLPTLAIFTPHRPSSGAHASHSWFSQTLPLPTQPQAQTLSACLTPKTHCQALVGYGKTWACLQGMFFTLRVVDLLLQGSTTASQGYLLPPEKVPSRSRTSKKAICIWAPLLKHESL